MEDQLEKLRSNDNINHKTLTGLNKDIASFMRNLADSFEKKAQEYERN